MITKILNRLNLKEKYKSFTFFKIIIIISILSLFLDIKMNTINSITLNNLTSILLPSLIGVSSIFVSCYFLIIQLYNNRYPLNIIKNKYYPFILEIICIIIYCLITGGILIFYNSGLFIQLWFNITSLLITIAILVISYAATNLLMINTHVDEYIKRINTQLENSICDISNLKLILKEIKDVFEECYIKEEYYVCQNISKGTTKLFATLISEGNKLLINDTITSENFEEFYIEIINYSIYQIEIFKDCKSEYLIEDIINNNIINIEYCINTTQLHMFKEYIDSINTLILKFHKSNNELVINLLFNSYGKICKNLIDSKMEIDWLKKIFDDLYIVTFSLNYLDKNTNLKHFSKFLLFTLTDVVDCKDIYKYLFKKLYEFSITVASSNQNFEELVVYYIKYSNELINKENLSAIKDFNNLVFEIVKYLTKKEQTWIGFLIYYLDSIEKKWEKEFSDIMIDKRVEIALEIISLDLLESHVFILPDFKKIVSNNIYNKDVIKNICTHFDDLFRRAVLKDNKNAFYLFSMKLNDCILSLRKESKDIQTLLFEMYSKNIKRVSYIENKIFAEILINQLEYCLNEMDKNNTISKEFGTFIIKEIAGIARDTYGINTEIINKIIRLLHNFSSKENGLKFILTDKENIKLACRLIFIIGTESIERNKEDSLRIVSNSIGWIIKEGIDRGDSNIVYYSLDRAKDLFQLSEYLNISKKTLTFIMTLFTTIGTYSCKEPNLTKYRDYVIKILIDILDDDADDDAIIKTAIKLRTTENDIWNDLFDNKTEKLSKEFYKKYEIAKSNNTNRKNQNLKPEREVALYKS